MTMLYNVTADLQKKDTKNLYMLPGIHENSELTSVEYQKNESGSEFIAFYFENPYKEKLSHTEWKVFPRKNIDTLNEKEKTLYARLINEQIARINKIVTTFISEEKFRGVEANSFEEFCKKTIQTLGDSYKGVKVRIKVVYDKRNFTALPSYTNYEWIEPMSVSKEESKIKILAKDKLVKALPSKLEGADEKVNEIEIQTNKEQELAIPKNEDDLPF